MLISPAYAQAAGPGGFSIEAFLPLILIFAVFYFLLIRPQQKKVKQHRELVAGLRRGDRIVTTGGIIGTIAKVVNEHELLVEIADGVRIRLVRSQVSEVAAKSAPVPGGKDGGDRTGPANEDRKTGGLFGKLRGS